MPSLLILLSSLLLGIAEQSIDLTQLDEVIAYTSQIGPGCYLVTCKPDFLLPSAS
jgi:hypothetical protein